MLLLVIETRKTAAVKNWSQCRIMVRPRILVLRELRRGETSQGTPTIRRGGVCSLAVSGR
jgi:hypothetical protein